MDMNGRTAFVTGGTGGIGTTICRHLAKAGVKVVAGYFNGGKHEKALAWQEEQRKDGYDIGIVFGNVRQLESCKDANCEVESMLGHLDILVNNAGVTRDSMFHKMAHEDWHDVITANLNSVFHITRLAINHMIERKYGRIINISSINAQKGQLGQTNYSAAKAGMHGFTKALAQEVARHGITVNTISPGYIATKMVMAVPDKVRDAIISNIPVARLGTPDEVARVVTFLAEDTAGYITGSNISVNGGQHMF
jgi:acetoacetyl-CoA reductase